MQFPLNPDGVRENDLSRHFENDDLDVVDADASSRTSENLSENSETYDFLMVCMPALRPPPVVEGEEESVEEIATKKGKAPAKAPPKKGKKSSTSLTTPKLGSGSDKTPIKRSVTIAKP